MALFGRLYCLFGRHEYHDVSRYCITACACKHCSQPQHQSKDGIRLRAIELTTCELEARSDSSDDDAMFGPACMKAAEILQGLLAEARQPSHYVHR